MKLLYICKGVKLFRFGYNAFVDSFSIVSRLLLDCFSIASRLLVDCRSITARRKLNDGSMR
ncbi:MAG: hypothetical protein WC644_00185 [Ignavibacteria bacterium]